MLWYAPGAAYLNFDDHARLVVNGGAVHSAPPVLARRYADHPCAPESRTINILGRNETVVQYKCDVLTQTWRLLLRASNCTYTDASSLSSFLPPPPRANRLLSVNSLDAFFAQYGKDERRKDLRSITVRSKINLRCGYGVAPLLGCRVLKIALESTASPVNSKNVLFTLQHSGTNAASGRSVWPLEEVALGWIGFAD